MRIQLITGAEATDLLARQQFLEEWAALHARCPWATSFQSHRFARAWYGTYPDLYEPVLIVSRGADGLLRGLLTLARSKTDRLLVVAGWEQAEYHSWVCAPEDGNLFPMHAARELRRAFPAASLLFRYLAPGTPLRWLKSPEGRRYCLAKSYRRPLLRLGDGSEIIQSLKKSSNKSRLKRLEKLGGFEFRRVTDVGEYESLFERIVTLYDFRHGAVQGSDPFCTIDRQKEFHVAMMKAGLLHVTVMKVAGQLAAAHFGVISRGELQLGTIVHDPLLAKHSPGKFQILLLSKMLHEEGFERFDLTPGGDSYKERFTNAADETHILHVLPTPAARARAHAIWETKEATKRRLSRRGLSPAEARFRVRRLRQPAVLARALLHSVRDWAWSDHELRLYLRDTARPLHDRTGITVRRDSLEDLLLYKPADGAESRQAFLSCALQRLESGQHAYTVTDGGRLRCCVWLDGQPGQDLHDVGSLSGFSLPAASAVVHDYRTFGPPVDAPPPTDVLRAVLVEAAAVPGVQRTVLAARGEDEALAQAARRLGFEHTSTLIRITRLGRASWVGVHCSSELLPRRPSVADLAASPTAVPQGGNVEEVETAGAV